MVSYLGQSIMSSHIAACGVFVAGASILFVLLEENTPISQASFLFFSSVPLHPALFFNQ
uniref:Endonuclease n=1 Tax=Solanum tuberosum TaxID=4113 RepID=M1BK36_SOLTU